MARPEWVCVPPIHKDSRSKRGIRYLRVIMASHPINKSKFVCRYCGHEMLLPNGFRTRSERDYCAACGSSFVEKDVKVSPNPVRRKKRKGP